MLVVFSSMTGNIRRFIEKLGVDNVVDISSKGGQVSVNEPFVLITYTIGNGETPQDVQSFLDNNNHYLRGVIGSGNRNWGDNFCKGAINVAERYKVPLLHTFELSGYESDVEIVTTKIEEQREKG